MNDLGFVMGEQRIAEAKIDLWAKRNFKALLSYCRFTQFFQDIPFSLPFAYVVLDQAFPNSKFILTLRDSPQQWYDSLTRFYSKKWGRKREPAHQGEFTKSKIYYQRGFVEIYKLIHNAPNDARIRKKD